MRPGDRVNGAYSPRGGYGYIINVAGVVKKRKRPAIPS